MLKETIEIKNRLGIHARPAATIAQEACKYSSDIFIIKDGMEVNAKSIMGIMMLAAEQGSSIELCINGRDEDNALCALRGVFSKIFEEE